MHDTCPPEQCRYAYPGFTCEDYLDAMEDADDRMGDATP